MREKRVTRDMLSIVGNHLESVSERGHTGLSKDSVSYFIKFSMCND